MPANRLKQANAGTFRTGTSGNPTGRPKKTEAEVTLEQMCREKTPEALAIILEIMTEGDGHKVKLSAAQYVIDRGWGKAAQSLTLEGGKTPIQTSVTVNFVRSKAT